MKSGDWGEVRWGYYWFKSFLPASSFLSITSFFLGRELPTCELPTRMYKKTKLEREERQSESVVAAGD
jgi:hypothetical protein